LPLGCSLDSDITKLTAQLGSRFATEETSFKYHASCRHTHPAADALLLVMKEHQVPLEQIEKVITHVHQGAIDVLGPVVDPKTVHQSKFSMGTVLALAAKFGYAGLHEFETSFSEGDIQAFCQRVEMQLDKEVDEAYPVQWIGKVTVITKDGRTLSGRVDEPKGDPGNTLSRLEIEEKATRLALFSKAATK
jgi:2-methylcitrate dehydratase PrpD